MSNAARKRRKRWRKVYGYPQTEIVRSEGRVAFYGHGMGRYQHPTREGIPYGRSKQPVMQGITERLPPLGVLPEFRGWVR